MKYRIGPRPGAFAACMVCIESEDETGEVGIGSAFHIGEGYLVTARHVVENRRITRLIPNHYGQITLASIEVLYPSDNSVDLALLRSDFSLEHLRQTKIIGYETEKVYRIELGSHLDDWINDESFLLMEIYMFGYPPIPFSSKPVLVATTGHINAVIDPYAGSRHPLFIVSPTARGGFSGGPVLTQSGWLLGVTTQSLLRNELVAELGYAAALTIEPLWALLGEHNVILPGYDRDWLELFGINLPPE